MTPPAFDRWRPRRRLAATAAGAAVAVFTAAGTAAAQTPSTNPATEPTTPTTGPTTTRPPTPTTKPPAPKPPTTTTRPPATKPPAPKPPAAKPPVRRPPATPPSVVPRPPTTAPTTPTPQQPTIPPPFAHPEAPRDFSFLTPRPFGEVHIRRIVFPVLGDTSWGDTYLAARDGGHRSHAGQDIFGDKMQPMVAAVDGTVVSLRHRSSSNSLTIRDADGWYYRYLHINNDTPGTDDGANAFEHAFAPGLREGSTVRKGQLVAYLGDSGNAEGTPPHLHFEIRMPNASQWKAPAVNAAPSLRLAEDPTAFDLAELGPYQPWASADALVTQQATDILGREQTLRNLLIWTDRLQRGELTPDELIGHYLSLPETQDGLAAAARVWLTMYDRAPSEELLRWVDWQRAGLSLLDQVRTYTTADEGIRSRFGGEPSTFVATAYERALHRAPTEAEMVTAVAALALGTPRTDLIFVLSQSDEAKVVHHRSTLVILAFESMLRRGPTAQTFGPWVEHMEHPQGLDDLVRRIRTSEEYAERFVEPATDPA